MTNEQKLASPKRSVLFFREDGFYPMTLPESTIADHAECNEGTIRVVDAMTSEIVWLGSITEYHRGVADALQLIIDFQDHSITDIHDIIKSELIDFPANNSINDGQNR